MINNFQPSQLAFNLASEFEGDKLEAYQDSVGVWTIGRGHTRGVYRGMVINQDQSDYFLMQDMTEAGGCVNKLVECELNQNQFDALCDFVFNLGAANLQKSTLLKFINAGQFEEAANEFLKWVRAGGRVLNGLVRRREAEKELFTREC